MPIGQAHGWQIQTSGFWRVAWTLGMVMVWASNSVNAMDCPLLPIRDVQRNDVYAQVPFKAGEEAKFSLTYGAVHVGYGYLRVKKPMLEDIITDVVDGKPVRKKVWHMQFQGEAYTGDWYNAIFQAHDVIQAVVRPWDFAVSRFYMRQDEKAALKSPVKIEKWLEYNQATCEVVEKTTDHSKNTTKNSAFKLDFGSSDVVGATHRLRTITYKLFEPVRFLVYSSEKSWWIEATSVAVEKVETEAGVFIADKIKLKTFIGQDMQQTNGDSYIWIAQDNPSRPILKVVAEVKIGSVSLHLESFKPGSE